MFLHLLCCFVVHPEPLPWSHLSVLQLSLLDSQDKVRKIPAVGADVEKEEPLHCYWECDWYGTLENAMDHYVIQQSYHWVLSQENQSSVLKN